jgi:hypothetical protein
MNDENHESLTLPGSHLGFLAESGDEVALKAPELNVRVVLRLHVQQYFITIVAPESREKTNTEKLKLC